MFWVLNCMLMYTVMLRCPCYPTWISWISDRHAATCRYMKSFYFVLPSILYWQLVFLSVCLLFFFILLSTFLLYLCVFVFMFLPFFVSLYFSSFLSIWFPFFIFISAASSLSFYLLFFLYLLSGFLSYLSICI
jgi:hypothetical protein